MVRRLSAEERALWRRVVETVTPIDPGKKRDLVAADPGPDATSSPNTGPRAAPAPKPPSARPRPPKAPGTTLDGSWDRRLARGLVSPDFILDLHGHRLSGAYHLLDQRLEQAIAQGSRLLLLITGKPPTDGTRPIGRGAIRAAIHDWLAASRHGSMIAAVRGAHPRHGGTGALYIVIRRPRDPDGRVG